MNRSCRDAISMDRHCSLNVNKCGKRGLGGVGVLKGRNRSRHLMLVICACFVTWMFQHILLGVDPETNGGSSIYSPSLQI